MWATRSTPNDRPISLDLNWARPTRFSSLSFYLPTVAGCKLPSFWRKYNQTKGYIKVERDQGGGHAPEPWALGCCRGADDRSTAPHEDHADDVDPPSSSPPALRHVPMPMPQVDVFVRASLPLRLFVIHYFSSSFYRRQVILNRCSSPTQTRLAIAVHFTCVLHAHHIQSWPSPKNEGPRANYKMWSYLTNKLCNRYNKTCICFIK